MSDVGLVLLAAGQASRMGTPKQLLDFRGQPLVCHAARSALGSCCRPVVLVIGAHGAEIRDAVQGLDLVVVENARWREGIGTSIAAGIGALSGTDVDGAILTLADQPMLTPSIYDRLVGEYRRSGSAIVTSEYAGTVGVPVLFSRELFRPLLALPPDHGCKGVILQHNHRAVRIPCPEAEMDIDTPADLQRLARTAAP